MNNDLQLALYKGKGNFYDVLVRAATLSKYSHVELVINGVCYTSSPRDNGVRSKVIDLHSGNWDVYPIEGDAQYALDFFEKEMGKPYDWLGAIKSVVPFFPNRKEKWFCSEIVAAALQLPKARKYTPEDLYQWFCTGKTHGF